MSKAEKFIEDYTRSCSNVVAYSGMIEGSELRYHEWLTPDQARRAVEIAREEMVEKALTIFHVVCNRSAKLFPNCEAYCNACKQFKHAMKDET